MALVPLVGTALWLVFGSAGSDINQLVVNIWLQARRWGLIHPRASTEELAGTLNALMLIPPATLAVVAFPRVPWWCFAILAFASSTTIETIQQTIVEGRSAEVGDVVANTVGGVLGALCGQAYNIWLHRNRDSASQTLQSSTE